MHTATPWPDTPERWTAESWTARGRTLLERGRDWLDARGRAAWIAAMVVGFIAFWPIGLALLAYMIWSKRMSCNSTWSRSHRRASMTTGTTGNAAFDAYRAETLKRLEEERDAFIAFLDELRAAKDRAEFDQFMARRRDGEPEVTAA
jgi:hypothetical protein